MACISRLLLPSDRLGSRLLRSLLMEVHRDQRMMFESDREQEPGMYATFDLEDLAVQLDEHFDPASEA